MTRTKIPFINHDLKNIRVLVLVVSKHEWAATMIYPTSTSPDLRRPNVDGRAGSQNERWDDIRLNRVAAAEAAMPPSNVADPLHHTAVAVAEAASPLDNFLSGEHQHKYPFGFTLSITSSTEHEHKLSLPAATPPEYTSKRVEKKMRMGPVRSQRR
jgi:hypothetical protein